MDRQTDSEVGQPAPAVGTEATRHFYDQMGWTERDGKTADADLFGVKEDGPIRKELHALHVERVRAALSAAGDPLDLLECGCGGNPERSILDLCSHYTGTDFSVAGLALAERKLTDSGVPHALLQADACRLPFEDGRFDAVYSAHMIYHIERPDAQRAALGEMMRVLRPGGVLALISANPRPLLFPIRLARRLVADTPVVGDVLDGIRKKPPLPYRPMSLGWMKRELARHGDVELVTYALPSTTFNQNVTELGGAGRLLWQMVRTLDAGAPALSAYLGNYVLFKATRRSGSLPDDRTRRG